jgi:hypothetical protein
LAETVFLSEVKLRERKHWRTIDVPIVLIHPLTNPTTTGPGRNDPLFCARRRVRFLCRFYLAFSAAVVGFELARRVSFRSVGSKCENISLEGCKEDEGCSFFSFLSKKKHDTACIKRSVT